MSKEKVTPYKGSDQNKKEQVAQMFDTIAHKYDFLNHFFSLGIDIQWRKKAIKLLADYKGQKLLDLATGTGDFLITADKKLNLSEGVGGDISEGMMDVGRKKVAKINKDQHLKFTYADSAELPFEDNYFDALTIGFGVRNFEFLEKGLSEMLRVVRPGGKIVILEFSKPSKFPIKQVYNFYFKNIMPLIGKVVSKDNAAYTYLPESVMAFPEGEELKAILEKLGYKEVKIKRVTGGIASIYSGIK